MLLKLWQLGAVTAALRKRRGVSQVLCALRSLVLGEPFPWCDPSGIFCVAGWDNSALEFLVFPFMFTEPCLFQMQAAFWKLSCVPDLLHKGLSAAACFLWSLTLIRWVNKLCEKHFYLLLQFMLICCLGTQNSSTLAKKIPRCINPLHKKADSVNPALKKSIHTEQIWHIAYLWSSLLINLIKLFLRTQNTQLISCCFWGLVHRVVEHPELERAYKDHRSTQDHPKIRP